MRKSNATGKLHKDALNTLKAQIEESFEHEHGPGSLPTKSGNTIPGIIVPHDSISLAGAAMAWSYFSAANADVYVIISTNHKGEKTVLSQEPVETPFGIVRVDQSLARAVLENKNITQDEEEFAKDTTIDVQLPYLQYLHLNKLESLKILPILLAPDADISELSADIKEALIDQGKKACVIAVTNITHYGSKYKFAPFMNEARKYIYEFDTDALTQIKQANFAGLKEVFDKKFMNICGMSALDLFFRMVKPDSMELQQYYTSGDLTDEDNPSISYASFVSKFINKDK